jgi:NAD(P)-dependent dehydrogenase (short-subunit alcohol dehydrogenase family)
MKSIDKKVIVFFGGSSKIFYDSIEKLLFNGAILYCIDICISQSLIELQKQNINNLYTDKADITKPEELSELLNRVIDRVARIDCVINAAAIDNPPNSVSNNTGKFEDLDLATWDEIIRVNLTGAFLIAKYFGGYMAKQKYGSLINISSIYSLVSPDQNLYEYIREKGNVFFKPATYSVSKAGVNMLSKYLAVYWAKDNVRVNSLALSGVDGDQDPDFKNQYCSRIPIGRMAKPSEIFEPLVFLISDGSSYVTGQTIVVDGGWTAI